MDKKYIRSPIVVAISLGVCACFSTQAVSAQGFLERVTNAVESITLPNSSDSEEPANAEVAELTSSESNKEEVALEDALVTEEKLETVVASACIEESALGDAANLVTMFGAQEAAEQSSGGSDVGKYLVGLCVPENADMQFRMAEYLITKGTVYNFYLERSLESLALYLDEAGVELGIRVEALEKDNKLRRNLRGDNDLKKAEFILDQEKYYSENVDSLIEGIDGLEDELKQEALALAGIARAHALNSTFFLSRGIYVSEKITQSLGAEAKEEFDNFREAANGNIIDSGVNLLNRLGNRRGVGGTGRFIRFAAQNGNAVVTAINNGVGIIQTMNPELSEVPEITDDEINADVERLSSEWSLPAEFEDEDAFAESNSFSMSEA